jgi:hypothetical protein
LQLGKELGEPEFLQRTRAAELKVLLHQVQPVKRNYTGRRGVPPAAGALRLLTCAAGAR